MASVGYKNNYTYFVCSYVRLCALCAYVNCVLFPSMYINSKVLASKLLYSAKF